MSQERVPEVRSIPVFALGERVQAVHVRKNGTRIITGTVVYLHKKFVVIDTGEYRVSYSPFDLQRVES